MLSRTDTTMLSALIVVTLSSGWIHYQRQVESPREPEVVEEVAVLDESRPEIIVPDFSGIADVRKKKSTFFDFMKPLIEEENQRILSNRQQILALSNQSTISTSDNQFLMNMAERYGMKDVEQIDAAFFEALLARVDIIPVSLALVQSANESGWGTSRFALQGNNFFGQWCFSKGCGIIPGSRPEGQTYEVRKFEDVAASVRSYMHNLNTHFQYEGMRELRGNRRLRNEPVTGPILAQGLYGYSIRGIDYVEELVSMIASNDLLRYDLKKEKQPES